MKQACCKHVDIPGTRGESGTGAAGGGAGGAGGSGGGVGRVTVGGGVVVLAVTMIGTVVFVFVGPCIVLIVGWR